jgi:hypothetical protein
MHQEYEIAVSKGSSISWLKPALIAWAKRNIDFCNTMVPTVNAVPYYYNERANISLLAAGAWSATPGLIALEEYVEAKRRSSRGRAYYRGRHDLYISGKEQESDECVLEFKQIWLRLRTTDDLGALSRRSLFSIKLEEAIKDAKAADYAPEAAVGGVFCTFKMAKDGDWSGRRRAQITALREWVREMKVADTDVDVLAACFPKAARDFIDTERGSKTLWYWPGVILALKTAE